MSNQCIGVGIGGARGAMATSYCSSYSKLEPELLLVTQDVLRCQVMLFAHFMPKSMASGIVNLDRPLAEILCCSDCDMTEKPNQPSDHEYLLLGFLGGTN